MNTRPITALVVVQLFLLVSVFILVGVFMKIRGYPDHQPWPALPILFREHFAYLFLVPVAWAASAIFAAARVPSFYNFLIMAGLCLSILIAFFGVAAVALAMVGPPPPLILSPNP